MNNKEERIGNANTEAFAYLLLANNYKAWLYEEKDNHGDALLTEYDHAPSVDDEWLAALQQIMHHGTRTVVVYLDPESFGGEPSQDTIAMLTATGILTYVLRAGSDIGLTLGPSGLVDEGPRELQRAEAR